MTSPFFPKSLAVGHNEMAQRFKRREVIHIPTKTVPTVVAEAPKPTAPPVNVPETSDKGPLLDRAVKMFLGGQGLIYVTDDPEAVRSRLIGYFRRRNMVMDNNNGVFRNGAETFEIVKATIMTEKRDDAFNGKDVIILRDKNQKTAIIN